MTEKQIKEKTKQIAISVAMLCQKLPVNKVNFVYSDQIIRSSASIGANYRGACRAKSSKDFIYKLEVVIEESDETLFFLELLAPFNETYKGEMRSIYREVETILKIVVTSVKTSKKNQEIAEHNKNKKSKIKNGGAN